MTERDVAIIGMACVFPKAPDLDTFWRNIRDGVDAITDVPAERWDPLYYDPESSAPDRFYAHRGGFIDEYAQFDAAAFGIMPVAARGAEPDQLMALKVATEALHDAGYDDRPFPHDNTSIILGRGNYLGPGIVRLVNITRGAEQLVDSLRRLLPDLGEDKLAAIKKDFQGHTGVYGPDTAIGLVPNLVASRIANRLDLGGSAYTVDAACASTLVAVDQACRELRDGHADMVIAGGVHLCHDPAFWSVFSQLGALSRTQQIRPFDRKADGLLIGEGVGMFVLKRLSEALKDDDRVYAVIRGTGVASDGRDVSLLTPRVEGQVLALKRAWGSAGLDPETVGLVEAHGTATLAGDAAELETLSRIFGPLHNGESRVPLGSVKSMIGHTMPAAGAAGLIKAALAAYHGILPPTIHCDEPNPSIDATRFRTISKAEPWEQDVRRAAVNAFGFGGINAHVIVDGPEAVRRPSHRHVPSHEASDHALVLAAPSQAALLAAIDTGHSDADGSWRLAVFDTTPQRLETARKAIEAGRARHGRDGIFFSPDGLLHQGGKIAFLFPGVEANFAPKVDDVAEHFGLPQPDIDGQDLEHQGVGVFLLNGFLNRVMHEAGVVPDLLAGHSVGEWSGMLASGILEDERVDEFVEALNPGTLQIADLTYVAIGAGADKVHTLIDDLDDVEVSHDNCIHQSIVAGTEAGVEIMLQRLKEQRILYEVLPFKSGFHSSALAGHLDFYQQGLSRLQLHEQRIPLWSATTCEPYPSKPGEISNLFMEHLVKPVRFRELVLRLYDEGVRVFVQVGQGSLTPFVDDCLLGKPHNAISLVVSQRPGMEQLRWACASMYVEGAPVDLERVGLANKDAKPRTSRPMTLELGVPLIKLDTPALEVNSRPALSTAANGSPLMKQFELNMQELLAAQDDVARASTRLPEARPTMVSLPPVTAPSPVSLLQSLPAPLTPAPQREQHQQIVLSLETYPELIDHSLFPQPPDWPHPEDRGPTVPMTMSLALIMDAAQRVEPARVPIAVEKVLAASWLYVMPPAEVTVTTTSIDTDHIRVKIGNFVEGTVVMADRYPDAPQPSTQPVSDPGQSPVSSEALYRDRWLFHGPRYRGVVEIGEFGTDGIRGVLKALPAKGALLDNAGQLGGLWIMLTSTNDRLAMPVRVERAEFFSADPDPDSLLDCNVWFTLIGRREVRFNLELIQNGRVYCRITGWEDWRFATGGGLFPVMLNPDRNLLATPQPGGFMVLHDPGWSTTTFEFLVRRFLSGRELEAAGGLRQAQRQIDWLNGRVAAKDAVRKLLFERGHGPIFPIEISIESEPSGRPVVKGPFPQDVRVSIAHKAGIAVAIAAEGVDPGIDVEKVDPRSQAFAALAFAEDELKLVPAGDRDEWLTRLWSAKEAAGKAAGTGLAGNPKGLKITKIDGERVLVEGRWVQTQRLGEFVVAWTVI